MIDSKTSLELIAVILLALTLVSCGSHLYHVVERGETLYSIGWLYGQDYRTIAAWNDIPPPYSLRTGQRLRVYPPGSPKAAAASAMSRSGGAPVIEPGRKSVSTSQPSVSTRTAPDAAPPVVTSRPAPPPAISRAPAAGSVPMPPPLAGGPVVWFWPTDSAAILQGYSAVEPGKRGLDIGGRRGDQIRSAAAGYVVYTGSGLPRYGKLIIVKHNDVYLSAYAHNDELLVREGESVHAGQRIATMGSTGTSSVRLHFEIRENGKPVDPLRYLPARH